MMFSGDVHNNLLFVLYSSPSALISKSKIYHLVWHQHLGHPRNNSMKTMNLPTLHKPGSCEVCSCSKMTLLPLPSHFSQVHLPLQRIHMDLVGPITPCSNIGFKYFLTVVDQYLSFKFVRFLKAKSNTFLEFEKLATLIKIIQDSKIKEIFSDSGGGGGK
jgi:hypothetical protein